MLRIDKDKCAGCGLCAGTCPESFQMDLDGRAEAIKDEADACAHRAAANCPAKAIIVEEDNI